MEHSDEQAHLIGEGTVVRTYKWGDVCSGTVVRREGDSVFIAWHQSFVESQLDVSEVEVWADAPQALREWRGGLGVWNPGSGSFSVEPVPPPAEPSL